MRNEKALIRMLRDLVDLLSEEANRNPDFAARLETVLQPLPGRVSTQGKRRSGKPSELPDIHTEWNRRDEIDFKHWLRDQPMPVLRALIRQHDFDPAHRTSKWKDAEKLAGHIAESLRARLARGSSFLDRGGK